MTAPSSHRKAIFWAAATLVSAAVLASIALSYPKSNTQSVLGNNWQCRQTAFLTSCTRNDHGAPVVHSRRTDRTPFRHA